jgi:hypothetical protein
MRFLVFWREFSGIAWSGVKSSWAKETRAATEIMNDRILVNINFVSGWIRMVDGYDQT